MRVCLLYPVARYRDVFAEVDCIFHVSSDEL